MPEVLEKNVYALDIARIATLRRARKRHWCYVSEKEIKIGQYYYEVVIGGAGLGSIKFPDRVLPEYLEKHFEIIRGNEK